MTLDRTKLLGLRIADKAAPGSKVGVKSGAKIGVKVGVKA